jgi:hypothetical protein
MSTPFEIVSIHHSFCVAISTSNHEKEIIVKSEEEREKESREEK